MSDLLTKLMTNLKALESGAESIREQIRAERLRIALKEMAEKKGLMEALKINAGGKA